MKDWLAKLELVAENETVPEGGMVPFVPTFAVNAYVLAVGNATGPEIEAVVYVGCGPAGRGPTVNAMAAEALAAPLEVPRNSAL